MRAIKFRGKRIDNGEWIYGDLQIGDDDHIPMIGTVGPGRWVEYIQVDENTIGQFTELKDKNGNEIYEDDILLDESGAYAVVYYSMGSFCVDFGEGFDLQYFTDSIHEICYVAGNIHDNPELLKGGEQ